MNDEFAIELMGDRRADGTVCISSPDLPLFSIVGKDDKHALDLAMKILPEYLKANVPEFVDLRPIESAGKLLSKRPEGVIRAHVIALTTKGRDNAAKGT